MRRLWTRIPALARGLGIVALVAAVVVVLSLEEVVATVGGLLSIAFFLAVAFFLFLLWRERRGDLEAWSDWNRRLFYLAIVLAVVAIGMAIGLGVPGQDAFALILVLVACGYVRVPHLAPRAPLLGRGKPRPYGSVNGGPRRIVGGAGFTGCQRRRV